MAKHNGINERATVSPYVDVFENEQEILVVADLPGVAKEDLHIQLEDSQLTIEGHCRSAPAGSPISSEYRPADFRRSFVLPSGIDREAVDAQLSGGVLRLKLPKAAALRPRRIEVRAG